MNDQRPTTCPRSADSSRNAGSSARSFKNAETGVSQSSMNVWRSGMRLCSRASSRTSSRVGVTAGSCSAATGKEDLLGVREPQPAAAQQDRQVIEDVGGLLGEALVGLLARRAGHLLGLLLDLRADARRVPEQLVRVGAGGRVRGSVLDRPLQSGQRL